MPPKDSYPSITVWPFDQAPADLKALSTNGGDEDWLAVVPPEYAESYIPWLDVGAFGPCSVDTYPHPHLDGCEVRIGCHA